MNALSPTFLDAALEVARDAAAAAAEVIHRYYRGRFETRIKDDASPVTQADVESEAAIRRVLRGAYPDHAIYGEEQGFDGGPDAGSVAGKERDFLWLVDPIDGTKSFVRGFPMFSTQIALMHRGVLLLGVSCASEFGETAWARHGGGAYLNGAVLRVADTSRIDAASISTGNLKSLARGARWNALGELLTQVNRGRGYGDFYHYHLLAQGSLDVVIESDVNILDIAALAVIVREAGGVFSDLDGAELDLDTRSVLATTPKLHEELLAQFKGWI